MRLTLFLFISLLFFSCRQEYEEPHISLEGYEVVEGFNIELIASEPLLKAPVALDFDNQGRIWVVEMPGFMHNIEGKGENEPNGTIKILEDLDEDGRIDHARIFLDSLVLPRALALVYDGLLYAEPPNLWFVEIEDDKPKNPVLVDSLYAAEGNPEHQPNGLHMNLDNWIYNAKSNFRYQRKKGVWKKEPTTFRGQWGISSDNFGRLYYNDNSRQLLGDHILPNQLIKNKFFLPKKGVNQLLTKDQSVYPVQPVLVNRGYAPGVLNADSLLVDVTAACGPLVYRGGKFPEDYDENVFVCVPEANLIKRNILSFEGNRTVARQAWEGKEFLTSLDSGFRPVSLTNGPDGNLYIVDMHIGVIQHHAYMSPYLKKISREKQMDTIVDMGRIFKVSHDTNDSEPIQNLNLLSPNELLELLKSDNGWIRDRAQQLLIHKNFQNIIPALRQMANNKTAPLTQLHALYTLKGMDALTFELLENCAKSSNPQVAIHSLVLLEDFAVDEHLNKYSLLLDNLLSRNNPQIDYYLVLSLGKWMQLSNEKFLPKLELIAIKHKEDVLLQEAILSGTSKTMEQALSYLTDNKKLETTPLISMLKASLRKKENAEPNPIFSEQPLAEDNRTRGAKIFRQICAACHGINGLGSEGLAPPIVNSEYLSAPWDRLGLIVLHGLTGPISIGDEPYDHNLSMPGLIGNESLTDEDISGVLVYVSNAFSDNPRETKPEKVNELRNIKSNSGMEFTEQELRAYKK